MKALAARRRNPIVATLLLLVALLGVGGAYALATSTAPAAATASSDQTAIDEGRRIYLEGCSSCHGLNAEGTSQAPTLVGVGAAAVHFQVATGRMPLAQPGAQAPSGPVSYSPEQIAAMAAYIASLAPGPAIPTEEQLDYSDADVAEGGVLFRINCAQCHQAAGGGGALSQGKYAPSLMYATPQEMYEAMLTGPQNMPVFSDATLTPEDKQAIMAYIVNLQEADSPGGLSLGRLGPVTEGLFLWAGVMVVFIGLAVWIGIRAR